MLSSYSERFAGQEHREVYADLALTMIDQRCGVPEHWALEMATVAPELEVPAPRPLLAGLRAAVRGWFAPGFISRRNAQVSLT